MGAKTDEVYRFGDRLRPRASVPYSLSGALFLTRPIPFVIEEDFRSPLVLLLALRHKPIRFGTVLDCNPPLINQMTAWLFLLFSKILIIVLHSRANIY